MSRKRRKIVSETQLERTEDSDLPNSEEKNLPDAKKSNSGMINYLRILETLV